MSGSTGEAIARPADASGSQDAAPLFDRTQRRIIDVEREAIVLMSDALESIGDRYGVYGFSGHGRDNVEFYVIKDISEDLARNASKNASAASAPPAKRIGRYRIRL